MPLVQLARDLFDFCYPGRCASCNAPSGAPAWLCETCEADLAALESGGCCQWCAAPLPAGAACGHCRGKGVTHYDRVVALGVFHDPLQGLVHRMKYHRRWTLAEQLADRLLAQERAKALLSAADGLVPVPLHPLRQLARGYNQARVAADRLGRWCGLPILAPARRVKHTPTQTHLHSQTLRQANLRDAFRLSPRANIEGKHLLVVDDVMTTGATLRSFARTLLAAHPASLSALVLAVADPRGRDFQRV